MKKIGITGGIGSGKTTVCKVLQAMGYPVFFADMEAKKLMENDLTLKTSLIKEFGIDSFKDGTLNRTYLSKLVFSDVSKLNTLNSLVHPVVRESFKKWAQHQHTSLVFQESALLFESNIASLFDKTILIVASFEERIERTIKRDSCTRQQVLDRINKQMNDDEKRKLADYVIDNSAGKFVIQQIETLIHEIQR